MHVTNQFVMYAEAATSCENIYGSFGVPRDLLSFAASSATRVRPPWELGL